MDALLDKVHIVEIEDDLLSMMEKHNAKVDRFTRKFSQNDLLLKEISNLPFFLSEEQKALPAGREGQQDLDIVDLL